MTIQPRPSRVFVEGRSRFVVSLFDESGNMLRPWAEAGYGCFAFDITNKPRTELFPSGGYIQWLYADLTNELWVDAVATLKPFIVFGFPPCTHLASSGAAHFARKAQVDPLFQHKAAELAKVVEKVGELCRCPWVAENPVGRLCTLWRKPNHKFSPHEYGGYLPEDDVHPRWPGYIPPRDAYKKTTCLWSGNGFYMPPRRPVELVASIGQGSSDAHNKLGGKSAKTKQIRSETPRGFAFAAFQYNHVEC